MGKFRKRSTPPNANDMKNKKTRLPSITNVRSELVANWKYLRRNFDRSEFEERGEDFAVQDVRLQVWEDGKWAVHVCSPDYDQDHRGYWGASLLSYDRQNLTELARDLIDQCAEECAEAIAIRDES